MIHLFSKTLCVLAICYSIAWSVGAHSVSKDIKNFQQNNEWMFSAGLPELTDFSELQKVGIERVIDLIPGDRSDEQAIVESLGMEYFNIQVEWEHPTLGDFERYVSYMESSQASQDKTLTHCKLNWRGSVFTYLYRVTQLNDDDKVARADLDAIWQVNDTWEAFIAKVKAHYHK